MDRKTFLRTPLNKRRQVHTTFSGLLPYTGDWTQNEVIHLLKRTMFGAKKADIDHFLGMSPAAAVDELLQQGSSPLPPVRDYGLIDQEGILYDDLGVLRGNTWVNDPNLLSDAEARPAIGRLRMDSLRKWWSGLIINQQRSIEEKMLLFWHHHYSVQYEEVGDAQMMYRHHALLRSHVLGNVKNLARDVTIDPAMLMHLNGYLNSRRAPDENYAREFQELFTIGVGEDALFTEDDVIAVARVLSGWRIRNNPLESFANAGEHDSGTKIFSAFYNNQTISGSDAPTELQALVDMIFGNSEAAKFICRKIYRFFVYYDISNAIEAEVIVPMADLLRSNNYDIKPVLEALFKSEHFYDTAVQACHIKAPFDILAGTLREFNVNFPAYTDYVNGYPLFFALYQNAASMQEDLFQPPDVSGYPAYTQAPMHYELWVNSNSLPRRADYTDALISNNILDLKAFAQQLSNPANPNALITDATALLLRYPLSAASKTFAKKTFLLNGGTDDLVWTNAWNNNDNSLLVPRLKEFFRFIMNLPEFHLC